MDLRVEIPDQSESEQFLHRVTRTQLERALMQAAPPTAVANERSKEKTRLAMDLRELMQEVAKHTTLIHLDLKFWARAVA